LNRFISKLAIISCAAVLSVCNCLTAFADVTLPDGAVAGLPEKLSVLDSDGNSVNELGEYFFYVEDMTPYETYSKDIQIMNLREDKAYHIYFYAEPVSSMGDIDLENECTAFFSLDGESVFEGKVTGESADGSINLSEEPIDLGEYEPGDSRHLTCKVIWDMPGDTGGFVDFGERIVSADGTEIVREGDSEGYSYGEVIFRWVFYAVVDEDYVPPKTGVFSSGNLAYIIAMAVALILIIIMLLLISKKKRDKKSGCNT
jgi:hypothetical protein